MSCIRTINVVPIWTAITWNRSSPVIEIPHFTAA